MFLFVSFKVFSITQVWAYTGNNEIRCDDICLDVAKKGTAVKMIKCHHLKGNQLWDYDDHVSCR